jgi:hypothetical protein
MDPSTNLVHDSSPRSPYSRLRPSEIRVVQIRPGAFDDPVKIAIQTVDLRDELLYFALSYVWNPADGTINAKKTLSLAIVKNYGKFLIKLTASSTMVSTGLLLQYSLAIMMLSNVG